MMIFSRRSQHLMHRCSLQGARCVQLIRTMVTLLALRISLVLLLFLLLPTYFMTCYIAFAETTLNVSHADSVAVLDKRADKHAITDETGETDEARLLSAMKKQGVMPVAVEGNDTNKKTNTKRHQTVEEVSPEEITSLSQWTADHNSQHKVNSSYPSTLKPLDAKRMPFSNHQTLTVRLSKTDSNRLYVEGDKITDFTCQQGFCFVDRHRLDKTGDALVTLGNAARLGTGFTAFVLTASGRQFTLYAVPEVNSGQTIGFIAQGGSSLKAHDVEKKTPYRTLVVSVIRAMINYADTGELPEGYTTTEIPMEDHVNHRENAVGHQKLNQGLSYQPVRLFKGGMLTGVVYAIQNVNVQVIHLHPKMFYQKGMVAGALSKEQLASGEVGYFYALIQEGASDV